MNDKELQKYIREETGTTASKMLICFIQNPRKLNGLNNEALKNIITEYAPVFNKFRYMLDGPNEIGSFNLMLYCRIANKPELMSILEIKI